MSYKRTFVFLIAFVALAVFFYVYETRGGKARQEAEEKAQQVLSVESENVRRLALIRPEQTVVVSREADEWRITEPVRARAEQRTVDQIIDALVTLKFDRDLGERVDLEPYGLSSPEIEIEIEDERGKTEKLTLGASTPAGGKMYVQRSGENRVLTVNSSSRASIDKSLLNLRDKTLFDFSVPDVKSVSITKDDVSILLAHRPEGRWMITSPEERVANAKNVTRLLDAIRFARIKEFVEEEASDLAKYGLDAPMAQIELEFEDGKKTLSFGDPIEPNALIYYSRRGDSRQVVQLGKDIFEKIVTDVNGWRDKHLLRFEDANIERLKLDSPAGSVTMARAAGDSDDWMLIEPEEGLADPDEVEDLLYDLRNARIDRFPDAGQISSAEAILKEPRITVRLWEKEQEEPHVLSIAGAEEDEVAYARTIEDGEIFAVNKKLLETFTIEPDKLKNRSVVRFDELDIEKIEIVKGGKSYSIERKEVSWDIPRSLEMGPYEVDELLWNLRDLKYDATEPKQRGGEDYGFDAPSLIVKLWLSERENPVSLVVGKKAPDSELYFMQGDDEGRVMQVGAPEIEEWLKRFQD